MFELLPGQKLTRYDEAEHMTLQRYRETMGEIAGLLSKAAELANKLAEEDCK